MPALLKLLVLVPWEALSADLLDASPLEPPPCMPLMLQLTRQSML